MLFHDLRRKKWLRQKQETRFHVNYTGKLADGTIFDTSRDRHPVQFTIGKGQLIAGFEQAVIGMNKGESKTVVIPADQAYGPRLEESVAAVDRKHLPADLKAEAGQRLEITQTDDKTILVTVVEVSEASMTLDANHPLPART